MEDRIISVLIGLIGACNNNPKTENTDRLVIKALAFSSSHTQDEDATKVMIDEIRAEKNRIAPGCAACTTPCGNTSDYDMSRIDESDEEICRVKKQILTELNEIAVRAQLRQDIGNLSETEMELLYKALSYVRYDMEAESLHTLLDELQTVKSKLKGE